MSDLYNQLTWKQLKLILMLNGMDSSMKYMMDEYRPQGLCFDLGYAARIEEVYFRGDKSPPRINIHDPRDLRPTTRLF